MGPKVLREVQTVGGQPYVDLAEDDCPINGLDAFDSLLGVEATDMLERRLGCKLLRETVFVSEDGKRAATVAEICAEGGSPAEGGVSAMAERLRLAREQAGLSQGQVARLLDKHRPTISEMEAGRRRVMAEEAAAFADLYEVSPSWLLGTEGAGAELDDRTLFAARELAKLEYEDLDRVLKLLRMMRQAGYRRRQGG